MISYKRSVQHVTTLYDYDQYDACKNGDKRTEGKLNSRSRMYKKISGGHWGDFLRSVPHKKTEVKIK